MQSRALAAAAAFAIVAPLIGASGAHAATFMPAAVQATCLSECFDQTHTYKQTIASNSFSGPVSIGAFSFDRALLGEKYQTNVFHVTFWTADGKQVGDFGHYMVGSLGGDVLRLKGDSFVYDPSLGNLVMKIELDGFGPGGAGGGFGGAGLKGSIAGSEDRAFTPPGIVDNPGLNFTPPGLIDNPGLPGDAAVTQPVPEPESWALMLLGFGGAGAILRRRRLKAA